ncbi:MAG: molybdopterin-dependent oxidoreductase [Microbacterium sp.]
MATRSLDEPTKSFCRLCMNFCPIDVEVEDGRVTRVTGDDDNEIYRGYTCLKGRAQPDLLNHPDRLLGSLKRQPDGSFAPIAIDDALDEIAERLTDIVARHGARSVAGYGGTMQIATSPTSTSFYHALMDGIGTPMRFDPNTIDQGGKSVAPTLLGHWMAPPQGFADADVALVFGCNPMVSHLGLPNGNPGALVSAALRRGMQLIVVDPRRTDIAKRATIHLQARPGHDPEILAAIVRAVIDGGLIDDAFVAQHVRGLETLREVVEPFTVDEVARRAGVDPADLLRAAEVYGRARRSYTMSGTGPSMSSMGTLIEYLLLTLQTICGRWTREGESVEAGVLAPLPQHRAQAMAPDADWRRPDEIRVLGLTRTAAGMPTAALPDEILLPGEGQVRALISWSGNPATAFPDQTKTLAALDSLELFVQIDPLMSASARRAHYVLAPTMPLEAPAVSMMLGMRTMYAQYTRAVVDPPPGSDLVEEWEIFYGLMVRMGLPMEVRRAVSTISIEPGRTLVLDQKPTTDELLDWFTAGGRVPLDELRRNPGTVTYPATCEVGPAEPGWTGRFDVANTEMMHDLGQIAARESGAEVDVGEFPFRLVSRRQASVINSFCNIPATNRGRAYNPAFLHPDDLRLLGLADKSEVEIRSAVGAIPAIVHSDPTVRRGVVSMSAGFGDGPERDAEFREIGASTSRLVATDAVFDRFIGQPQMSNVPVVVVPRRTPSAA